jgi:hypothetical protein
VKVFLILTSFASYTAVRKELLVNENLKISFGYAGRFYVYSYVGGRDMRAEVDG